MHYDSVPVVVEENRPILFPLGALVGPHVINHLLIELRRRGPTEIDGVAEEVDDEFPVFGPLFETAGDVDA